MIDVEFDFNKLDDEQKKMYQQLDEDHKNQYREKWVGLEKKKLLVKKQERELKDLEAKRKTQIRKKRTKHLIEVGAIVEKYIQIEDLEAWGRYCISHQTEIKDFINRDKLKQLLWIPEEKRIK